MDESPRMPARPPAPTREDRLKAALRANVARRKAQAKARDDAGAGAGDTDGPDPDQG